MINKILDKLNSFSKLDKRHQIKYISPEDYIELAKQLEALFDMRVVIQSDVFKDELLSAIEQGEDTDYLWDGENELRVDTFDAKQSLQKVLDLLSRHFV